MFLRMKTTTRCTAVALVYSTTKMAANVEYVETHGINFPGIFTNNPFYNSLLYSVYFTLNTVGNYETGSTGLKIDAATSEVLHTF